MKETFTAMQNCYKDHKYRGQYVRSSPFNLYESFQKFLNVFWVSEQQFLETKYEFAINNQMFIVLNLQLSHN